MNEFGVQASDITFVVRTAEERTAAACVAVLRSQLGDEADRSATVVRERPFSAAVRRTLEIGHASDRPFVVGMDADVLLASDGVATLRRMCGAMTPDTYSIVGLMLCRFFGGYCFRGIHVYRREHLGLALGLLGERTPGGPDPTLKPESAVVEAMRARGFGFVSLPVRLGIHDYEQSYLHIYLKMRLRARRELDADGGASGYRALAQFCERRAESGEFDFEVALWGLQDGAAESRSGAGFAEYDWFARRPEFEARMGDAGASEKPALDPDSAAAAGFADRIMRHHRVETDGRTPAWIRERLLGKAAA